ncbi:MAG: NAD(P)-binding protein [Bradyrhizobium sp.]|nr:MAG: NAD(P)-binding protein [Bradyrhizobium sp.]
MPSLGPLPSQSTDHVADPAEGRPDADGAKYDAVVLGAGISGLVSASVLIKQGCSRVLVIDEYPHVGGNHIDRRIGDYTFDIGSFIFQDDSPLLAHLPEILPRYVPIEPSWGRLNPQGMVTQYPISIRDDLVRAGPHEWLRIMLSVLYARLFQRRRSNAREFARYWIGARLLYRSGLENYMRRFYGVPPERIDIRFAEKRMLWIKEHAMVRNLVRRLLAPAAPSGPRNTQLARPAEGFSYLYDVAVKRLESSGVTFLLGQQLHELRRNGDAFRLQTGDGPIGMGRVVSTIPLDRILRLCGKAPDARLSTVTLISLFFSFSGDRGFRDSILYNFSHEGAWKRLTVYSDFYGRAEGREYFTAEVNADHVLNSVEVAEQDFRRHVAANRIFNGDLKLEGSHVVSNAYPVYTDRADEFAAETIADLRAFGVESIGRQGGFDYQPTARVTTLKAEEALQQP